MTCVFVVSEKHMSSTQVMCSQRILDIDEHSLSRLYRHRQKSLSSCGNQRQASDWYPAASLEPDTENLVCSAPSSCAESSFVLSMQLCHQNFTITILLSTKVLNVLDGLTSVRDQLFSGIRFAQRHGVLDRYDIVRRERSFFAVALDRVDCIMFMDHNFFAISP